MVSGWIAAIIASNHLDKIREINKRLGTSSKNDLVEEDLRRVGPGQSLSTLA